MFKRSILILLCIIIAIPTITFADSITTFLEWYTDDVVTSGVGAVIKSINSTTRTGVFEEGGGKIIKFKPTAAAVNSFCAVTVLLNDGVGQDGWVCHKISDYIKSGYAVMDIKVEDSATLNCIYVTLGGLRTWESDGYNYIGVPLKDYYIESDIGNWKTIQVPFSKFVVSDDNVCINKAGTREEIDFKAGVWQYGVIWKGGTDRQYAYIDNLKFVSSNLPVMGVLAAEPNGDGVILKWGAVSGAAKYNIYRDNIMIASTTELSYKDTAAKYAKTYSYYVDAVDSQGTSIIKTNTLSEDSAIKNPDTSTWFDYEYPDSELIRNSPLDASYVLDAPSGKHGFVIPREPDTTNLTNNTFYFEDGTEAKFFGINTPAEYAFPEKRDAFEYAERLAQLGFNLVRFHYIDQHLHFSRKGNGDRIYDEDKLDRMFYFMSELKKRGIYYTVDLSGGKEVTDDDNSIHDIEKLQRAYKVYGYFDKEMQRKEKEFELWLLSQVNPYTGLALKDDPSMALVALKNEDSVGTSDNLSDSPYYYAIIKTEFNKWLRNKYSSLDALSSEWAPTSDDYGRVGLRDWESPYDNTVEIAGYSEREINSQGLEYNYTRKRNTDCIKFLVDVQIDCFKRKIQYLRHLGIKCPITGVTAWTNNGAEKSLFYSNTHTNYIDSHQYWMSTNPATSLDTGTRLATRQQSMFDARDFGIIGRSINRNVYGMPMVISEWNSSEPNAYNSESMLMLSAFGAFQGWHPVMFAWQETEFTKIREQENKDIVVGHVYNLWQHPDMLGSVPAAATMFLRNDITKASRGYYANVYSESFGVNQSQYSGNQYIPVDNYYYGLVGKAGIAFDECYSSSYNDTNIYNSANSAYNGNKSFVSYTGELKTDLNERYFVLNTKKSQAFTGFVGGRTIETDDIKFTITNPYATVYVTSLTNNPIASTSKMLLTTVGRVWNSGQVLSADGTTVIKGGTAPIKIEPVCGDYIIKNAGNIKVYALNSSGQRTQELSVTALSDGSAKFTITVDNAAMHYEVERIN